MILEWTAILVGVAVVVGVLRDTFHTIVMPKTVVRRFVLSNLYFALGWSLWRRLARPMRKVARSALLSAFGPLAFIGLLVLWAALLVVGFALLDWGSMGLQANPRPFGEVLYFSGVTFFTLGYGDVVPRSGLDRLLGVVEAGVGFGFLAVVIGYIPVLYSLYSRREPQLLMLDQRAGSDPSGGELLRRHLDAGVPAELTATMRLWEEWSAQHLEAFLSYPLFAYYRSQHDEQSWLGSLSAVLDGSALVLATWPSSTAEDRALRHQAQAAFAMGRHLIVDLAYVFGIPPSPNSPSRLTEFDWRELARLFERHGLDVSPGARKRLEATLHEYEPFLVGLARHFVVSLPSWTASPDARDNWRTTAWDGEKHF